jgi:AraC family transcriptional regulator of adaptative response/methylated-DNA-[protein]-cysteine methyltransferase
MAYTGGMTKTRVSQQAEDYQRVEQAIRYLEAHFRQRPSLDEVAASAHLSKYHFQRLFRRWAGVSPTQFLGALTVAYAKERLAESRSVLDTALDVGLSGPGRLHDLFVTHEAVTPGEYKQQGAGLEIRYGVHPTPFGPALLAITERGICGLHFAPEGDPSVALAALSRAWPEARYAAAPADTLPLVEHIFAPVSPGERRPFHLLLRGTNFQVQVWQALLQIPPRALVSYGDVAAYLGRPGASRAVAGAVARNPIAYLIPCHRVIRGNGRVHRYRWGAVRKKALVAWEASQPAQA